MAEVDADVVEAIVRWYLENGGGLGSMRLPTEFGQRGTSFSPLAERERVGMVLAECPERVPAGNPFNPEATTTLVERAIQAEIAVEATLHQLRGCPRELTVNGWEPTPLSLELVEDLGVYQRMATKYRAHPKFQRALDWLCGAFGRIAYGDPERGVRSDPSFLPFVTGA